MPTILRLSAQALALMLTTGCVVGEAAPSRPPGLSGMPFEPSSPQDMAHHCGADRLQHLVGQSWPQTLPARPGPTRIYATGDPVTMDHRPDRLNIELTRDRRRVVAVQCG